MSQPHTSKEGLQKPSGGASLTPLWHAALLEGASSSLGEQDSVRLLKSPDICDGGEDPTSGYVADAGSDTTASLLLFTSLVIKTEWFYNFLLKFMSH